MQSIWKVLCLFPLVACLAADAATAAEAQDFGVPEFGVDGPDLGAGTGVPWPPLVPDPRPPLLLPPGGTPPLLPPLGPPEGTWWTAPVGSVPLLQDLRLFVGMLEQARSALARWVETVQQAASEALARMIWESPGLLPRGVQLPDITGLMTFLSPQLRSAIDVLLAKLQAPVVPGSSNARHQTYTENSPALAHEAVGIVESDQILTSMAAQQAAASRTTALAAAGAAQDARLPAAVTAGYQAGQMLVQSAGRVPSTRAGVELLVAATGMTMRQQADLGEAIADRLTVLAQQTAAVSQQVATLAAATGTLAARETERDRQAIDARLGLADVLSEAGRLLGQMLADAGEPLKGDTRIVPLY